MWPHSLATCLKMNTYSIFVSSRLYCSYFSPDKKTVKVQWWLWHMAHQNRRWFIRPQWSIKSPVISNLSLDIYFHTFCLIDSFFCIYHCGQKRQKKILFHIWGVTIKLELLFVFRVWWLFPPRVLFNKFFLLLL